MPDLAAHADRSERLSSADCLALLTSTHVRCARHNEGAIVLLTAPVGHQGPCLLRDFAQRVDGDGSVLLRASADRGERSLPFAVIEQLAGSQVSVRAELTAVLDDIVAATPELGQEHAEFPIGAANSGPLRRLCRFVADLAATKPVVVIVDGAQHADRPSIELLLHIGRRLRSAPLLLLFAGRPELTPDHPDRRARVVREADVDIRLNARRDAPPEWAEITGGNPELVDALMGDRRAGRAGPGDAFDGVVSAWVHAEDPLLVATMSLLAADAPPDRALLGRILGVGLDTVDRAMALLAEVGPIRPGHPVHPAFAGAVLRSLPTARRARLRLDLAKALYDSGADNKTVVGQLAAAGQPPDEWAFAPLWDAADGELSAGNPGAAAELLRLTLRATITDRQRARALVALARIEWRNRPSGVRQYVGDMVAAASAGHCDDADLATVVKYLAWLGAYAEADRVLAHWCAAGRECTDELRKTTHWLRYAHFRLARRVSAVQSDERPTGAPRLLGIQAVRGVLAGGPAQPWITDAEQILRQTRLVHRSLAGTVEPSQAAILALLHAGRLDLAAIKSDELLARIADLGADTWLAAANSLRAEIAVRRGEPRMAIDHARRALDLMDADSWGVLIGIPLGCLVTGLSLTGRHDDAATALAETVPEVMFESRAGLCYLQGRATAAATQHRWPDALRDNERCGWIMREHGVDLPVLVDWRTGAARAHLELDRPDLAASLVREVLDLPGGDRPGVRGPALRVLAATVPHPQERVVLLTAAAQLLDGEGGNRVELCGALRELSRAHQAVGETTKARACADKAALHHAGPHREMAGLSDAERRVAALTADGRSNREVADTLLITVSTVEQHLTRIYRKLDIACRQELVTLLRPDSLD